MSHFSIKRSQLLCIKRSLIIIMMVMVAVTSFPLPGSTAVESNHVRTRLPEGAETTLRIDPAALHPFEVIFNSELRDHRITMNFSGQDSGGAFDPSSWEVTFDPAEFTVGPAGDVTVTVTLGTNLTRAQKGRSLGLTVWGMVADDEHHDIVTNSQTFHVIIADRDDVELSADGENLRKTTFPSRETQFEVGITNTGWDTNTITLSARITDPDTGWTVRVISSTFFDMASGETRTGAVNVTSPEIRPAGDYTLEVTAHVGPVGRDVLNLTARIALPDLSVKSITPLYDPALAGVSVPFKVVVENRGGHVENVLVRGEIRGHEEKWERLPDQVIPAITNYNESEAIFTWTALMTRKDAAMEQWTVRIIVDYLSSIEESNEGNNEGTRSMDVRAIEKESHSFATGYPLIFLAVLAVLIGVTAARRGGREEKGAGGQGGL